MTQPISNSIPEALKDTVWCEHRSQGAQEIIEREGGIFKVLERNIPRRMPEGTYSLIRVVDVNHCFGVSAEPIEARLIDFQIGALDNISRRISQGLSKMGIFSKIVERPVDKTLLQQQILAHIPDTRSENQTAKSEIEFAYSTGRSIQVFFGRNGQIETILPV